MVMHEPGKDTLKGTGWKGGGLGRDFQRLDGLVDQSQGGLGGVHELKTRAIDQVSLLGRPDAVAMDL